MEVHDHEINMSSLSTVGSIRCAGVAQNTKVRFNKGGGLAK